MIPPVASNFVAGESAESAVQHVADINESEIAGMLNLLGEHYDSAAPANRDARAYLDLLDLLGETDVRACVSIKPSQIGLDVGVSLFRENGERIAARAAEQDALFWIDMEDYETTDATLDLYESLARKYPGRIGVCVQANLQRTATDLERLATVPGKVRLVKGAYDEPASISYTDKSDVDRQYRRNLEYMFEQFDGGIAVGSHDLSMIEHAKSLHEEFGTEFEVQMLMGVREDIQRDLADDYEVYQYVPYGEKWLSYFYRRVRERKENLKFAARAVLDSF